MLHKHTPGFALPTFEIPDRKTVRGGAGPKQFAFRRRLQNEVVGNPGVACGASARLLVTVTVNRSDGGGHGGMDY